MEISGGTVTSEHAVGNDFTIALDKPVACSDLMPPVLHRMSLDVTQDFAPYISLGAYTGVVVNGLLVGIKVRAARWAY